MAPHTRRDFDRLRNEVREGQDVRSYIPDGKDVSRANVVEAVRARYIALVDMAGSMGVSLDLVGADGKEITELTVVWHYVVYGSVVDAAESAVRAALDSTMFHTEYRAAVGMVGSAQLNEQQAVQRIAARLRDQDAGHGHVGKSAGLPPPPKVMQGETLGAADGYNGCGGGIEYSGLGVDAEAVMNTQMYQPLKTYYQCAYCMQWGHTAAKCKVRLSGEKSVRKLGVQRPQIGVEFGTQEERDRVKKRHNQAWDAILAKEREKLQRDSEKKIPKGQKHLN